MSMCCYIKIVRKCSSVNLLFSIRMVTSDLWCVYIFSNPGLFLDLSTHDFPGQHWANRCIVS